jgi:hypothetical protein
VWFWSNAAADLKQAVGADFHPLDAALDYLRMGGGMPFPPDYRALR